MLTCPLLFRQAYLPSSWNPPSSVPLSSVFPVLAASPPPAVAQPGTQPFFLPWGRGRAGGEQVSGASAGASAAGAARPRDAAAEASVSLRGSPGQLEERAEQIRAQSHIIQVEREKMQLQLSHKRARVELERAASTSARSYEVGSPAAPEGPENPEPSWLGAGALPRLWGLPSGPGSSCTPSSRRQPPPSPGTGCCCGRITTACAIVRVREVAQGPLHGGDCRSGCVPGCQAEMWAVELGEFLWVTHPVRTGPVLVASGLVSRTGCGTLQQLRRPVSQRRSQCQRALCSVR